MKRIELENVKVLGVTLDDNDKPDMVRLAVEGTSDAFITREYTFEVPTWSLLDEDITDLRERILEGDEVVRLILEIQK